MAFTDSENDTLSVVNIVASSFSLVGSLFIIACYVLFRGDWSAHNHCFRFAHVRLPAGVVGVSVRCRLLICELVRRRGWHKCRRGRQIRLSTSSVRQRIGLSVPEWSFRILNCPRFYGHVRLPSRCTWSAPVSYYS